MSELDDIKKRTVLQEKYAVTVRLGSKLWWCMAVKCCCVYFPTLHI